MPSDGTTSREPTRTATALLAIVGFVLIAAVLPVVGGQAPGQSLLPDSIAGQEGIAGQGGQSGSAVQRALQGQSGGAGQSGGDSSMVDGLLSQLAEGSGAGELSSSQQSGGQSGGQRSGGDGSSGFGALNPGDQTSVGSSESLVSDSLRNQSSTPHLIVQSTESSYWRTGAYNRYTGTGWDRVNQPQRANWPRQPSVAPDDRRTVEQTYRLLKPATSLPTVWEPTNVDGNLGSRLSVTSQGGVRSETSLPANTTYSVTSQAPPRDPDRLRQAGQDYPGRIERSYTQLPDSTPQRVAERTERITADADTPYEKATSIERWLEANKNYSLDASHDGGNVADQFIFEMDQGYCEYFATSMTVMLRSQGIPARYTVGYSTGQPTGNGTYLVRAMNAHAWVEVYFPETGWVRFDPTPGRSRLGSEREAIERALENGDVESTAREILNNNNGGSSALEPPSGNSNGSDMPGGSNSSGTSGGGQPGGAQPGGDGNASDLSDAYNHTEEGSPGESFDTTSGPSYSISLQTDPVPGSAVPVLVERDSEPASGVVVTFNGEQIGATNESGMVRGTVPYTARLAVSIRPPDTGGAGSAAVAGPVASLASGTERTRTDHAASVAGVALSAPNGTNTTREFEVATDITVDVETDPSPDETVTLNATIDGNPIPGADVSVNGSRAGETDEKGQISVTMPASEWATVEAERGDAYGNSTLRLANISVATSGFALPGLSITVSVTDGGEPVEGATVSVGDTTVETGPDGAAEVSLPIATSATLTVETPGGLTTSQPVDFQFLTAGVVALVVVVTLGALFVLRRQALAAGRSITGQVAATLRWLSGAFVSVLVGLAIRAERLRSQLPVLIGQAVQALRTALAAAVAAIRSKDVDFSAVPGPRAIAAWLIALFRSLLTSARESLPDPDVTAAEPQETAGQRTTATEEALDPRERIRAAWRTFRTRLPVTDYQTKTPGELGRVGIDEGYSRSDVETLQNAVRAVEYGRREPDSYLDDVAEAEQAITTTSSDLDDGETGDVSVADGGEQSSTPQTDGGDS